MDDTKEILNAKIANLKSNHELIKSEMIMIVDASKILNDQYVVLESKLYKIEEEYVKLISILV